MTTKQRLTIGQSPLRWSVRRVPALGRLDAANGYWGGDFFVQHGTTLLDRMIQLVTQSHWNHAGVIISPRGTVIEAVDTGLVERSISATADEFFVVHLDNVSV